MAQKTNLNVSPYFDDFGENGVGARDKNYYKVLFNPGRAIQARELNTLQSILQDQIESFGSNIFKEGSVVIPGAPTFDDDFNAVRVNPAQFGVPVISYLENLVGQRITGQSSNVSATVQLVQLPNSEVSDATLYVKYRDSGNNNEITPFEDGEGLIAADNIVYGNSTITAGETFATTLAENSTATGSAASVADGIYFVRGTFVRVPKQTIILDYYTNTPSYRVGFNVSEEIITSQDDDTLFDNASGFTNFAAPGADRFKISLNLTKKSLTDLNDVDFIEILRVRDGAILLIETKTQYNIIRDYLAERTFAESGHYVVDPFEVSLNNSLNNRLGNDGIFFPSQQTDQGNTPSDDLMCYKLSPGEAYVKGYDITKEGITVLDSPKPRTTETIEGSAVPFTLGNLLRVNNVSGTPALGASVNLFFERLIAGVAPGAASLCGTAKAYAFTVTDAAYTGASTNFDLYLFDIQTYVELTFSTPLTPAELPEGSRIKGMSSGATGYVVTAGSGILNETSGTFLRGEAISIDDVDITSNSIAEVTSYNISDIKSVSQTGVFASPFVADTVLESFAINGQVSVGAGGTITVPSPGNLSGVKVNDIIRYSASSSSEIVSFNRITDIAGSLTSGTVVSVSSVDGVAVGDVSDNYSGVPVVVMRPVIRTIENSGLFAPLPEDNVARVDLNRSNLSLSAQANSPGTPVGGNITLSINDFDFGNINTANIDFEVFDEERYSISYTGQPEGSPQYANLTPDKVSFSADRKTVIFNDILDLPINAVNATFVKNQVQNRVKQLQKSQTYNLDLSNTEESGSNPNASLDDGLTFNRIYGVRVQDETIALPGPDVSKVIAIYESLDKSPAVLDSILFPVLADVTANAIVGENIIGTDTNTVARIVQKTVANTVSVVYLNESRFDPNEVVNFEESGIVTNIAQITLGSFKDITNSYVLDQGQRLEYLDYSRIIRKKGIGAPTRQLTIVFDRFIIPSDNVGDVVTVNSYDASLYNTDTPLIGPQRIRATDVVDVRPRVTPFTDPASLTRSPFDVSGRVFDSIPLFLSPNESSTVGLDYYVGRVDRLVLDEKGIFSIVSGTPSLFPKAPSLTEDVLNIASIVLPPYLYNPADAQIVIVDNRRYTMRDIGRIEDRVENLEEVTSLSLLEVDTQTLQIKDSDGLDRFKSGIFVDDYSNTSRVNNNVSRISVEDNILSPQISRNSISLLPAAAESITNEDLDFQVDFPLFDSNVQKTGESITLAYNQVDWLEQPFATRVENINPFNVISYRGAIALAPAQDTWQRNVRLPDVFVNNVVRRTQNEFNTVRRQENVSRSRVVETGFEGDDRRLESTNTTSRTETTQRLDVSNSTRSFTTTRNTTNDRVVDSGEEIFMRSRNTAFFGTNLKPFTRYYPFLDSTSGVDIIPKLLEVATDSSLNNDGTNGTFQVGENVRGIANGRTLINFRLAQSNHKFGSFRNPDGVFTQNPYNPSQNVPGGYSPSSNILNVDTVALSIEAQGLYSGYVTKGMRLIGENSGATAFVKDIRLITDVNGSVAGTFFLRDPLSEPAPTVRIRTGSKTFALSSNRNNSPNTPGSNRISNAETIYRSTGTFEVRQRTNTRTDTITTVNTQTLVITDIRTTTTTETRNFEQIVRRVDPLAQTFTVGGNVEAPNYGASSDDFNGAFLTAVDLFFNTKDSGNAPVTVEIRTVELGTPTLTRVGNSVTLDPSQINTSNDASVATRVTFDTPIFLPPDREYALVLLSPESDEYEVWIAEMGETTIETQVLPDSQAIRYTQQFALGGLFKSQNGSIWTANQYQDLKFKLYKAEFTSTTGSAIFYNPTLAESNSYVPVLQNNPLTAVPRKLAVEITPTGNPNLTFGRFVSNTIGDFKFGQIEDTGAAVTGLAVVEGGVNYIDGTYDTRNISGKGSGLTIDIVTTNGAITSVTAVNQGSGYKVGDVVTLINVPAGQSAQIRVSSVNADINKLFLTNVQADTFEDSGSELVFIGTGGARNVINGVNIIDSTPLGGIFEGNYVKVDHFEHGMYAANNKVQIFDAIGDLPSTLLTQPINSDNEATISLGSTEGLSVFEGIPVGNDNPGYIIVEGEIISYTSVNPDDTISGITRGIDGTQQIDHFVGTQVFKYEIAGISLRRINNVTQDVVDDDILIDSYYFEIDLSSNGVNRAVDNIVTSTPRLGFDKQLVGGGNDVKGSQNILYGSVQPLVRLLDPGAATNTTAQIRTVSGTSVSGNEISFEDQQFQDIELNVNNALETPRIVCSQINEETFLSALPRNKSFTLKVDLSTTDSNISPQIFWRESISQFNMSRFDQPVTNYAEDGRVNDIFEDPNASVYYTNTVRLAQPANSLKVTLAAYRDVSADIRVLYSLIRPDSAADDQKFELFPGYENLTFDNNQDGFLDVVNPLLNNGLPDDFVEPSLENEFKDYEFSATDLGEFTGYTIKVIFAGTNQAKPPRLRDIRTIALA